MILNLLKAFLIGGLFCVVGQILIDKTNVTAAKILTSYVVIGVLLGAIGLYEPIVKFAGAGATVPLTGFGYALAKGTQVAVKHSSWIGVLTGGLTAAAAGVAASIVFSFIAAMITKPNDKSD